MPAIEVASVKRILGTFNTNTSYGPSNLTIRHLNELSRQNEMVLISLTQFINFLASPRVPDEIKPFVFEAKLIALNKNDNDIRLIAIGNIERRIASKVVSEYWRSSLLKAVLPHQHGIAQPNAMEYLIGNTSISLEEGESVLLVDFENAFNSINRNLILSWVYNNAPDCYAYVWNSYGTPSN